MFKTLLRLVATQPQLLADHAEAYADLASAEVSQVAAFWQRRAIFIGAALGSLLIATFLVGVAILLWAVIPSAQMPAPWALFVTPLPLLAVSVGCWMAAQTDGKGTAFGDLRRQFKADLAMLDEVSAT